MTSRHAAYRLSKHGNNLQTAPHHVITPPLNSRRRVRNGVDVGRCGLEALEAEAKINNLHPKAVASMANLIPYYI